MGNIKVRGCRTNNLKNISVDIPINKVTCISGPSGSGKTSFAFHTLGNESRRRFLNSMPSSLNFFDRVPKEAEVDLIDPVLPVWILPQGNPIIGSRLSLVDQLELTTELAEIYFDSSSTKCLIHHEEVASRDVLLLRAIESFLEKSAEESDAFYFFVNKEVYSSGIRPSRSFCSKTKKVIEFNEDESFAEAFRIKIKKDSSTNKLKTRLEEISLLLSSSSEVLFYTNSLGEKYYALEAGDQCLSCNKEGLSYAKSLTDLIPFNGIGACSECGGYGANLHYSEKKFVKYQAKTLREGAISVFSYTHFSPWKKDLERELKKLKISLDEPYEKNKKKLWPILWNGIGSFPGFSYVIKKLEEKKYKRSVRILLRGLQSESLCGSCGGTRISPSAARHRLEIDFPSYGELLKLNIFDLYDVINRTSFEGRILKLKNRISKKLKLAIELGLGHLKISTKLKALDSNEYQKSLLIRYLSYEGSGSLFVLDEPSVGLGLEEQKVLMKNLLKLSKGNTVLVVDHSEFIKSKSSHILEFGPRAGSEGGKITYIGKYRPPPLKKRLSFKSNSSLKEKSFNFKKIKYEGRYIESFSIPKEDISQVHCEHNSFGKKVIRNVIANHLNSLLSDEFLNYDVDYSLNFSTKNLNLENIILFESTLSRGSSRSTVGTVLGLTPYLRKHFASLKVSKDLGLEKGHFSPNSDLGKCQNCDGKGFLQFDMQFIEDIQIPCDECNGRKLNRFFGNISDGNFTFYDSLNMPISELFNELPKTPKMIRVLEYLKVLNLDYLSLDRTLPSLSGGERLRIKLVKSLEKELKNSLLIFDNLSSGLSSIELESIQRLLLNLKEKGNTILILDRHEFFDSCRQISINFH